MHQSTTLAFAAPPIPYCLDCGEDVYPSGGTHPNRYGIPNFDLLVVTRGALHMAEEGTRWSIGPGQMLLLVPGRHHYAFAPCREETHFYWLHFQTAGAWAELAEPDKPDAPLLGELLENHSTEAGVAKHRIFPLYFPRHAALAAPPETFKLLAQLVAMERESHLGSAWRKQQLFQQLLTHLTFERHIENAMPAIRVAEKTEAYLKRHYQESLSNEDLQRALHFHPNYLARCMKQAYGVTPLEFLQNYRLEQAKLLLLRTEYSITRIAEETGFRQISHFTRRFSDKEGMSPLQFRKSFMKP